MQHPISQLQNDSSADFRALTAERCERLVVSMPGDEQLRNSADAALRLLYYNMCAMAEWKVDSKMVRMEPIVEG